VTNQSELPEVAFYYPGPMWQSTDAIKNLLLFCDGVALLVPEYMKGQSEFVDPVLAGPLLDRGLLHILEPETLVDAAATEKLVSAVGEFIESGALDPLSHKGARFAELSIEDGLLRWR